jgi:hypothetical protein
LFGKPMTMKSPEAAGATDTQMTDLLTKMKAEGITFRELKAYQERVVTLRGKLEHLVTITSDRRRQIAKYVCGDNQMCVETIKCVCGDYQMRVYRQLYVCVETTIYVCGDNQICV